MKKQFSIIFLSLALIIAFAGCGGGYKSSSPGSSDYASSSAASEIAPSAAPEIYAADDSRNYDTQSMAEYDMTEEEAGYDFGETAGLSDDAAKYGGGAGATITENPNSITRKIITTIDIRMESTEYDKCAVNIEKAIEEAGGYIEHSDIAGNIVRGEEKLEIASGSKLALEFMGVDSSKYYTQVDRRYMNLSIRIPQSGVKSFVKAIENYGQVLSKTENARDVTLEYVDIESHKKSLLIEQEQLLALLEQSRKLEDMIALQDRLSNIRYQIENFEARLRVIDNQVSYATVYLSLNEVLVYTEVDPEPIPNPTVGERIQMGFNRSLASISRFWTDIFVYVASNIIYIAVTLILLAAAFILSKRALKKLPVPQKIVYEKPPVKEEGESSSGDGSKKKITSRKLSFKEKLVNLFVPPFEALDKIVIMYTLINAVLVIASFIVKYIDYYIYLPGFLEVIRVLVSIPCILFYLSSHVLSPAMVLALLYRRAIQAKVPEEKYSFKLVGTILFIAVIIILAFMNLRIFMY